MPMSAPRIALMIMALGLIAFCAPSLTRALEGKCATCDIKAKTPVDGKPGQYDFEMACAFDITSEEKPFHVFAKDEDEARLKSQTEAPGDCW